MASRLKEKKLSRFDIKAPSKIMVEILLKGALNTITHYKIMEKIIFYIYHYDNNTIFCGSVY
jgi:hypothetical protein